MSSVTSEAGSNLALLDNLRSFLHLTTQAPIELVCKSSLYLLTNVPSTRHAVLEYIGTFYKVAAFLHLRFNFNLKNADYPDLAVDTNNINHINQVIQLIEVSLNELIKSHKNSEVWVIELAQWSMELIGDIVVNTGMTFADTPGLSNEEVNAYKNPSIVDGLEIWANQCKPTLSLLNLIKACFDKDSSTQTKIIDLVFINNNKYQSKFDWFLYYMSILNAKLFVEKLFLFSLKESLSNQQDVHFKVSRTNVINFLAKSDSSLIINELAKFLNDSTNGLNNKANKSVLIFLLKIAAQSSDLLDLLVDDCLTTKMFLNYLIPYLVEEDESVVKHFFHCLKQIDNCVAIYEIIRNLFEWLKYQSDDKNAKNIEKIIVNKK